MTTRLIRPRGNTAAHYTSTNPVLSVRELVIETDTGRAKQGDGTTAWNSLPYITITPAGLTAAVNALIDAAPTALDTLNELASAVGDDPNFAATVAAGLAGVTFVVASPATTWGPFSHGFTYEPNVTCVTSAGDEFIPDTVHHGTGTVTVTLYAAASGTLIAR